MTYVICAARALLEEYTDESDSVTDELGRIMLRIKAIRKRLSIEEIK